MKPKIDPLKEAEINFSNSTTRLHTALSDLEKSVEVGIQAASPLMLRQLQAQLRGYLIETLSIAETELTHSSERLLNEFRHFIIDLIPKPNPRREQKCQRSQH